MTLSSQIHFTPWDYLIFAVMLAVSLVIGLYHALSGKRQRTTEEFFMADRNMHCLPLSLSLISSFQSAISIIGVPAEIYAHGTQYWFIGLSYIPGLLIPAHFFIPMFYKMNISSIYQYLERRFSKIVQISGTLTFIFQTVIYMGVCMYAPTFALSTVTGIELWKVLVVTGLSCTLYTTVGGLKGVIWTDVFQTVVMLVGQFITIIVGVYYAGGATQVYRKVWQANHISGINLNPDPTERHTFWTLSFGGFFLMLSLYGVNQIQVQRYLSARTKMEAMRSCYMVFPSLQLSLALSCVLGLVMFACYSGEEESVELASASSDKRVIFFMMDMLKGVPGMSGLFVSCLFSAALSSLSSALNSLATVTMEDLIRPNVDAMREERATWLSKLIVAGYGLLCLSIAFMIKLLGESVLQVALKIFGMVGGPVLGLFSLGMFFPCANSYGALTGLGTGLAIAFWIGMGSIFTKGPDIKPLFLNYTTVLPPTNFTTAVETTASLVSSQPSGLRRLYLLSYMWYSALSCITVIVVGLVVSYITGPMKMEAVKADTICSLSKEDILVCGKTRPRREDDSTL